MKVVEKIFEYRIWQLDELDDMQFVFVKGMRVNMNKTKVFISGEWQKITHVVAMWCLVLVVIQCSVLDVRGGYTRSVLV